MIYFDDLLVDHNGAAIVDHNSVQFTVNKIVGTSFDLWSIRRDGDTFSLYINDALYQTKTITGQPTNWTLSELMQNVAFICREPYQLTNFYIADHVIGVDPDKWQSVPVTYQPVEISIRIITREYLSVIAEALNVITRPKGSFINDGWEVGMTALTAGDQTVSSVVTAVNHLSLTLTNNLTASAGGITSVEATDDNPIFWGIINNVSSPAFMGGEEVPLYRLSVSSGEMVFNNRLISGSYTSATTQDIVEDLFDEYIADEGFLLGSIAVTDDGLTYDDYNFSNARLFDILQELATEVNASFYVSADKKFYFLSRGEFPVIDPPTEINNLNLVEESGNLRNVQIITGITEETALQTESFAWAANQTFVTLAYPVSSISEVTINGTPVDVGVMGVDSDDTTYEFLYTWNSPSLNKGASTSGPTTGDVVVVKYYGRYDATYYTENGGLILELKALNGTSGKIENILQDETVQSLDDAEKKAAALLTQYGERDQRVSLVCHDMDKSALLTLWPLNYPDQHIVGEFVVTERTISGFSPQKFAIQCKLNKKNFVPGYGTVFKKRSKSVGKDTRVYRRSVELETIFVGESFALQHAGLLYYPVASGTELTIPALDGMATRGTI